MEIVVRRSGGIAGMTRTWHVDTAGRDDTAEWDALVAALPRTTAAPDGAVGAGARASAARDDFSWAITIERTTTTVSGSALGEPWSTLVRRVRDEGRPA